MSTELRKWPEPGWLGTIPDEIEREAERVRLVLSLACLYHSQKGSPATLAEAIGMTPNAFAIMKSRGKVSPQNAIALEGELGRDLFPREAFRPDLFEIEG